MFAGSRASSPDAAVAAIAGLRSDLRVFSNDQVIANFGRNAFAYFRQISVVLSTTTASFSFLLVATLLMIGTGALAPHLIRVHAKVRPIERVAIWGRNAAKAESLAAELSMSLPTALGRKVEVRAVADRRSALADADIISCATLSRTPLVEGEGLRAGQHVDLVGAYTPEMRESDDKAVWRARVYVDTRAGALKEAGDIVLPLRNGTIDEDDLIADLYELSRGQQTGRLAGDATTITLFKSVGAALEDLAAAELAVGVS